MPERPTELSCRYERSKLVYIRNHKKHRLNFGDGSLHVTKAGKSAVLRARCWYLIISEYLIVTIEWKKRIMTTLLSPAIPRGRVALVALWITQIGLAGMFLFVGGLKLTGAPELVALFDAIGIGQWFRYVTGSIEAVSAVALLVPAWAAFGALLLVPTMVGAVVTHLFIVGGSAAPATVLLIGAIAITWARRDQLASVLSRQN